jgi:hypothetical protein
MIWWRAAPGGGRLTIRWLPRHRRREGRLSLWGTVIESERGWRASHAYPSQLFVPPSAKMRGSAAAEAVATVLGEYSVAIQLVSWEETPDPLGHLAAAYEVA